MSFTYCWDFTILILSFACCFFFYPPICLFLYLPWSLLYSGSFPWPPLSFMALTWHVFEECSLLSPLLPFLIECSFWGSSLDSGYAFWSEYHIGDTMLSGFGHTGSICSLLEMFIWSLGQGGVQFVQCIVYVFFYLVSKTTCGRPKSC